jgi:hypothetical protein
VTDDALEQTAALYDATAVELETAAEHCRTAGTARLEKVSDTGVRHHSSDGSLLRR